MWFGVLLCFAGVCSDYYIDSDREKMLELVPECKSTSCLFHWESLVMSAELNSVLGISTKLTVH